MTFTSRNPDFTLLAGEEELQTLRLNRLYRDWCQARRGRALPPNDFIDPQRHSYLDGMLMIVDVERNDDRLRYRYRSVGHHFLAHLKVDPAGIYMDQHPDSAFALQAVRACGLAVEARRPVHARIDREIDGRSFTVEFLLLPVAAAAAGSSAEAEVAVLLIAQIFTPVGD